MRERNQVNFECPSCNKPRNISGLSATINAIKLNECSHCGATVGYVRCSNKKCRYCFSRGFFVCPCCNTIRPDNGEECSQNGKPCPQQKGKKGIGKKQRQAKYFYVMKEKKK